MKTKTEDKANSMQLDSSSEVIEEPIPLESDKTTPTGGEEQHDCPFYAGMKVEVGIPLPDNRIFRDWAIINETDNDLVSLQLSRDILPSAVTLRIGQILNILGEIDFQPCNCRAYIVSKSFDQTLLLRLTGTVVAHNLREFYRVDAFLPIKLYRLHDQNPDNVRKLWEDRKQQRQEDLRAREKRRKEAEREMLRAKEQARKLAIAENGHYSEPPDDALEKNAHAAVDNNEFDESWNTVTPVAVNISGGGIKISTGHKFDTNELILLEILTPMEHRIVDVVARVIFSGQEEQSTANQNSFNSALQFIFIDEYALSAISRHINDIQIQRIRHFKGFTNVIPTGIDPILIANKQYAYLNSFDNNETNGERKYRNIRDMLISFCLIVILYVIISQIFSFLSEYADTNQQNSIPDLFKSGIKN